jgi:hypothetical protein
MNSLAEIVGFIITHIVTFVPQLLVHGHSANIFGSLAWYYILVFITRQEASVFEGIDSP